MTHSDGATRQSGVNFVHGDAMRLLFPDVSFGAVTIGFGMPHASGRADQIRAPTGFVDAAASVVARGAQAAYSDGSTGWFMKEGFDTRVETCTAQKTS
ncbi:class I SAM-dependent methyltransferase [Roseovarius tibetensis]|uniref:class I SAM-dependent methyltransferase n=1 Tax=Roseovarius tibetensis TaxID=2685897 RepID=UPI003D7F2EAC